MIHIIDNLKKIIKDLKAKKVLKYKSIFGKLKIEANDYVRGYNDVMLEDAGFKFKKEHIELTSFPGKFVLNWSANKEQVYGAIEINSMGNVIVYGKIKVLLEENPTANEFLKRAYYFDVPSRVVTSSHGVVMLWDRETMKYPELWFMEDYKNFGPLELDLGTYFEALAVTKGFRYWQIFYLSAADYKKYSKQLTEPTEEMYPEFKKLFPDQDYTDLDRRYNERVKSKK